MNKKYSDTVLSIHEIEYLIANLFGIRKQQCIITNVSWGFFDTHEADMVVVRSNYMTEIEIKRAYSDFMHDFIKTTSHDENKVQFKYFAVPASIVDKVETKLSETENGNMWGIITYTDSGNIQFYRLPENITKYDRNNKLTDSELIKLMRLGCMRQWNYIKHIAERESEKRNNITD
jgi:hypothetical protein